MCNMFLISLPKMLNRNIPHMFGKVHVKKNYTCQYQFIENICTGMKYFRGVRPAEYTPISPCQCKKFVLSNKDNPPLVLTIHAPSSYRAVI